MRRLAGTWFAKALFIVLILSFGAWGIEDTLRNLGRDTTIARVGSEKIDVEEAQDAARRELQRVQRQLQGRIEINAAIRRAVAGQAVETLVLDRVVRLEGARMGLAAPDDAVRDYIFQIPAFQGPDNRFSRLMFDGFLRNNDLTEARFLALLRADLARQQLAGAVRAGAATPEVLADRLLSWNLQQRTASLVELPFSSAPEPEAPSQAQLERFHENNASRFSTPEYRDVAVATLNAARIMGEVEVSDRDVEDGYAANHARFETPEKRQVFQVVMQDQAAAEAIAERWRADADWAGIEAAAQAAGGLASTLPLSTRAELPLPELAEAVFALAPGTVSAPVQSAFGWHVMKLGQVEAGHTQTLDEVRDQLRQEIASERAADMAFERVGQIEDALAGGATLTEAAQRFSLGFFDGKIDANGRTPEGTEAALPVAAAAKAAALRAIFSAERGAAPRMQEGEWGFMAVELRDIQAPALRPLDTIREQVTAAYLADARRRHQEEVAAALLAATRAGKTLAEAATEAGLTAEELGPFGREAGGANPMPRDLLAPVFELRGTDATMVQRPQSFAVVQLLSIAAPDLAGQAEALTTLRSETTQAIAEDLEAQFQAALRARANVRINPALLDQIAGGE
ncbi:peptidyl-prolyl cis-trans isomerase [Roseococcus sp.]|uniref:peptidylprolyl isomerase n=1 Tax=Roseococcus sp. TaxID=2109646 RepID=UPI003BAAB99B